MIVLTCVDGGLFCVPAIVALISSALVWLRIRTKADATTKEKP